MATESSSIAPRTVTSVCTDAGRPSLRDTGMGCAAMVNSEKGDVSVGKFEAQRACEYQVELQEKATAGAAASFYLRLKDLLRGALREDLLCGDEAIAELCAKLRKALHDYLLQCADERDRVEVVEEP